MSKIINLQNNILQLPFFTPQDHYEQYRSVYEQSELGQLGAAIPWEDLVREFRGKLPRNTRGPAPVFPLRSQLALMFLKSLWACSDRELMDRLRTDWAMQFFCEVYIAPYTELPHFKMISAIRCELARYMDMDALQVSLVEHWKPYMEDTTIGLVDATCYETWMRYPTDEKLLWESCAWLYKALKKFSKSIGERMPRSKFKVQKKKQQAFQKQKKKTYKQKRRRRRALLYLLGKLIGQVLELEIRHNPDDTLSISMHPRFPTILKVWGQQQFMYDEKTNTVPERIVSLDKDYIRPIVRGKETKRVEWGAKVNMLQVDGINFIEHLNFEAFHEGKRLQSSVRLHRKLFGKCTHISADQIYATNANRSWCRKEKIQTGFVRKGRAGKHEKQRRQLAALINTFRATRLEGSFGCEKEHYHLKRVKARTKSTEILWIFFGVMTANAVRIAHRMAQQKEQKKAA